MSTVASVAAAATDIVHQKESKYETIRVQGRRLNILGKLGEGSYSVVYLVQDPQDPPSRRYALKRQLIQREDDVAKIVQELEHTQRLSCHPFICSCHGYEITRIEGKQYSVMMQQHGGTPLVALMQERQQSSSGAAAAGAAGGGCDGIGQADTLRVAFHIGSAISWLHHQEPSPVAHRDIKAENILYQHGIFRLVDFGSATTTAFDGLRSSRDFIRVQNEVGAQTTLAYRAPEMCDVYRRHRIDQQVDVWALGVLLYYTMYFKFPFEETTLSVLAGRFAFPASAKSTDAYNFEGTSTVPEYDAALLEAVRRCLVQNPSERWTVDELLAFLAHAFPIEEQEARIMMEAVVEEEAEYEKKKKEEEENANNKNGGDGDRAAAAAVKSSASLKPRTGATVTLIAEGKIGVQDRSPMLSDEGSAAASSAIPTIEQEAEEAARKRQQQQQQAASAASSKASSGALFSKLKWNAGAEGPQAATAAVAVPPPAPASSQQMATAVSVPATSSSSTKSIDDLFAAAPAKSTAPSSATVAGGLDLFATTAPSGAKPSAGGISIFGTDANHAKAAAAAPVMFFGSNSATGATISSSGVLGEKKKQEDPFANLFK